MCVAVATLDGFSVCMLYSSAPPCLGEDVRQAAGELLPHPPLRGIHPDPAHVLAAFPPQRLCVGVRLSVGHVIMFRRLLVCGTMGFA